MLTSIFSNLNNFHQLVDRYSETQLQVGGGGGRIQIILFGSYMVKHTTGTE